MTTAIALHKDNSSISKEENKKQVHEKRVANEDGIMAYSVD